MKPTLPANSMHGKACLITGATSGIGLVTARTLAEMDAKVFLTGRNPVKAERVAAQIREDTQNPDVHPLVADHEDLQQIRALAEFFRTGDHQLDVLLNNAGTYFNTRQRTKYGVEKTFLVNHLSSFTLTNLLLEGGSMGAKARIVNVTSGIHRRGSIDLDDLEMERGYFGLWAYARSKLANVLFTYELARRMGVGDVTVNVVHPGTVATDIFRSPFSIPGYLIKGIVRLFALTPARGAKPLVYLVSSPEVEGITGKYYIRHQVASSSPESYDEALAAELWEVSARLSG